MEQLPLKDIHIPEPIGIWPLAWGWYGLIGLLIVIIIALIYGIKRIKQRAAIKSAAKLLAAIKQQKQDNLQSLADLSIWLRRVVITVAPRSDVASLTGTAWLNYLDSVFTDAPFSQGVGRCLADSPYRKNLPEDIDIDQLFSLCERWLAKQKPRIAVKLPRNKLTKG